MQRANKETQARFNFYQQLADIKYGEGQAE